MNEYITLRTYDNWIDAEIDFAKLNDEELRVFINNRNTANILPHYALAIGGIKIQIHKDDLKKGLEAIAYEINKEQDVEELFGNPMAQPTLVCPNCGSSNYFRENSMLAGLFFWLLAVVPVPIPKNIYHCSKCDHRWKVK
ncbi:MAG: hypothetical protein ACMZ7B_05270 [Balneola sp.]